MAMTTERRDRWPFRDREHRRSLGIKVDDVIEIAEKIDIGGPVSVHKRTWSAIVEAALTADSPLPFLGSCRDVAMPRKRTSAGLLIRASSKRNPFVATPQLADVERSRSAGHQACTGDIQGRSSMARGELIPRAASPA